MCTMHDNGNINETITGFSRIRSNSRNPRSNKSRELLRSTRWLQNLKLLGPLDKSRQVSSWQSVVNLPSASTSLIMSASSASVGFCPSDLITVPSSLVVMVPSPSLSNSENASLNSGGEKNQRSEYLTNLSPVD